MDRFLKMRRAMKKIMLFAAFAAALTFSSCNKEAKVDAPSALRTVNFSALPTETKTVFGTKDGNKYPVLWQAGDKINYTFNFGDIPTTYTEVTPSADGKSASFSGKFAEASSYQFIFVSPADAFKSRNKTNGTIMVEIPSGQSSTSASPDPSAQILYANTGELVELPDPVSLNFSHLTAYLHIQFENVALGDAVVQAVNVTNNDYYLAGRLFYKFNDGTFEDSESSMFHTIAVSTNSVADVWVALRPVDLSGKQLTLVIATDKGTFTKTVTMPASASLTAGKIAKFPVDMTGVALEAPVVYKAVTSADQLHVGDKVIIAAADVEQAYAMSTGQNSNNRSQAGVTKTLTEIVNPTDVVEIIKLEDGVIPGHYAMKATGAANPGYLYAASLDGAANYLRTKAELDLSGSWDISIGSVTIGEVTTQNAAIIKADIPDPPGHGTIRHNPTSVLFSAYASTSGQKAVMLYRLDEPADESPRFKATLPNGNDISADAQEVPVYVFGNVAWTASATGGATLSESSGTGNKILTLTVPANTDTENTKSYTVTVTTTAAVTTQSYTLNLTQAKKVDTSGDPVKVYSFTLTKDNNMGTGSGYASSCDILINGITWNVTGVSNSTSYDGWRIGGKSLNGVDRAIYSKTALAADVTKVVVTHTTTTSPITVNTFTMSVHSTADDAATGTRPIASLTGTVSTSEATVFEKQDNTSWAGCYYRLNYNVTNTTTSNKAVQFKGLEIWGYPAS